MINPILSDWFFNYPHPNYETLYEKYINVDAEKPDDDWYERDEVAEAITKDSIQFMKDNSIIIEEFFPEFVGAAEKLADDFMRRL
jgi:hypothetical protein